MMDNWYMIFPDNEEGRKEREKAMEQKAPVSAVAYVHIYFEFITGILTGKSSGVEMLFDSQYKERLDAEMTTTTAEPFLSEKNLPEFFQPIVQQVKLFRDEILNGESNDIQ